MQKKFSFALAESPVRLPHPSHPGITFYVPLAQGLHKKREEFSLWSWLYGIQVQRALYGRRFYLIERLYNNHFVFQ